MISVLDCPSSLCPEAGLPPLVLRPWDCSEVEEGPPPRSGCRFRRLLILSWALSSGLGQGAVGPSVYSLLQPVTRICSRDSTGLTTACSRTSSHSGGRGVLRPSWDPLTGDSPGDEPVGDGVRPEPSPPPSLSLLGSMLGVKGVCGRHGTHLKSVLFRHAVLRFPWFFNPLWGQHVVSLTTRKVHLGSRL